MAKWAKAIYLILAAIATLALAVIAYKLVYGVVKKSNSITPVSIDYTNAVVILLTTVTVIFSVCAVALAVLGVFGFRNLKRDAGRFASREALREIGTAFEEGGVALAQIELEFTREDGHLKRWVDRRLRQEVIELLPLIIDRLPPRSGRRY